MAAPSGVLASSFVFQTGSVAVKRGQTFQVPVTVNPAGQAQYTVRVALDFPANLLTVEAFTFASGWLPLSQPGYDSIDNTRGELLKTAGLASGFSSSKLFGTVTFRAKKTGAGDVVIGTKSVILNSGSQNTSQSRPQVRVSITEPAATAPTPTAAATPVAVVSQAPLAVHPTAAPPVVRLARSPRPQASDKGWSTFLATVALLSVTAVFYRISILYRTGRSSKRKEK